MEAPVVYSYQCIEEIRLIINVCCRGLFLYQELIYIKKADSFKNWLHRGLDDNNFIERVRNKAIELFELSELNKK